MSEIRRNFQEEILGLKVFNSLDKLKKEIRHYYKFSSNRAPKLSNSNVGKSLWEAMKEELCE